MENISWHEICFIFVRKSPDDGMRQRFKSITMNTMKYIITILFAASLLTMGMVATAMNTAASGDDEYGESVEYLITTPTHVCTGLIIKTSQGMAITTNRGTFILRGPGVEKLAGKTVRVKGVLRDEVVFAMTIDVNS